jgi:hypothetical protein
MLRRSRQNRGRHTAQDVFGRPRSLPVKRDIQKAARMKIIALDEQFLRLASASAFRQRELTGLGSEEDPECLGPELRRA